MYPAQFTVCLRKMSCQYSSPLMLLKAQSLCMVPNLILETALGEVEKNGFIAFSGKKRHSRLTLQNQCVPGFPSGLNGKASVCNAGDRVRSLGWEDPRGRKWQPTPVFLPGKSHGPRSLVGYLPWGCRELDTTE